MGFRSSVAALRHRATLTALLCSTAIVIFSQAGHAQEWTGAVSGEWGNSGNWNGGTVPNSLASVAYVGAGTNALNLTTSAGTINYLYLGKFSAGNMTVSDGGSLTATTYVGDGDDGTLTVTGTGTLTSATLFAGASSKGTIDILNGGKITANTFLAVGRMGTAEGKLNISGTGSTLTATGIARIGEVNGSQGEMNILSGGKMNAGTMDIGVQAGATGLLKVNGTNSIYSGTGTLNVGSSGTGTLTAEANGAVSTQYIKFGVNANSSGTGTLTGGATLSSYSMTIGQSGSGILTLSGAAAATIDTTIKIAEQSGSTGKLNIGAASGSSAASAGTLSATEIAFGAGTGELVFNHTESNYILSTPFSGNGTIKQLAGTTILTGNSSSFTGSTEINGGKLLVNGTLPKQIDINSGGTLGGTGTVELVYARSGGTLTGGNIGTIGTLNVTTDVTLNSGSTLHIDVSNSGNDKIAANGVIFIDPGAKINFGSDVAFVPGGPLQFLTAQGGIYGSFSDVMVNGQTSSSATISGVNGDTSYSVTLTASQSGKLVPSATSSSGTAAAGVLDAARGNSAMSNLISVLDSLSSTQKAAALTSLSGQSTATLTVMPTNAVSSVVSTVLNHNSVKPGASAPARFGDRSGISTGEKAPAHDEGAWVSAIGGFGSTDQKAGSAGTSSRTGGLAGGFDFPLHEETLTAGVSFGYVGSKTDIDGNGGNANAQAGFAGLYSRLERWGLRLDSTLMGGYHTADQKRNVVIGTATSTASSDFDGYSLGGGLQVSKAFDLVQQPDFDAVLRPYVGLNAQRYWQQAYRETGAGTANLSYDSMARDSVVGRLGTAWEFGFMADKTTRIAPLVSLGVAHTFTDTAPRMDAAFALLPDSRFSVQGAKMAQNALEIGLGLDVIGLENGTTFTVGYGGTVSSDAQDHSFSLRAKMAL